MTMTARRMSLKAAAEMLDVDVRTIARWIDAEKLGGGRPRDEDGNPLPLSHRWVDAEHVERIAAAKRRDEERARALAEELGQD